MRIMKINPKFIGGMLKTMSGLRPIMRRAMRGSGASVVRPLVGQFRQISLNSPVKMVPVSSESEGSGVKPKQTYRKLKFSM
jgi:hypothetical protein